ncbi:Cytochrome P450 2J2 [Orchesella cincta]|uniref:Cytochrome P450 2J2 n=1 Tax=Orchesella cincta TaxID=48709 RepID=A0A1D2M7H9_ORCCI|nr:Cytochrome P450 2J2 [Orchesella cincta]
MLNDPNLVKELFSDVSSAGRTVNPITNDTGDKTGVFHSQGSVWKSQRRFTHKKLRDIGVFKDSIGELLSERNQPV